MFYRKAYFGYILIPYDNYETWREIYCLCWIYTECDWMGGS